MSDVTMRPACEGDIKAITDIYAHHVLHGIASFEETPPSLGEMLRRFKALNEGGFPYVVAEINDVIVGYAYAGPYRPRPAYRFCVENSVYLGPDQGGQGIGSALVQNIIDACTASGFRQMIAVIGDSGNLASINLHRRFGFVSTGIFEAVGFKKGRWVDSVLMQLTLGDGKTSMPVERPR